MIEGDIRREKIIEIMSNQKEPVSGSDLAKKFGVSRQVIVQDIALLRATNKNILSTNKGYFLYNPGKGPQKPKRSFCVQHTTEQMQDELYTIVDYGGKVLDAVVEHDIYGQITVDLMLCNRMDVDEFMERIRKSKSQPLNVLTGGKHWHTVEADTEPMLHLRLHINQTQRRNDTEKEWGLQVVLPLDLGLRLPEDKSLSLLIEITEEMDYRELYAAYP